MLGRLLQENDKKRSNLDKLARDQDLLQQLQLHGLEGIGQGKLARGAPTKGKKERLEAVLQSGE